MLVNGVLDQQTIVRLNGSEYVRVLEADAALRASIPPESIDGAQQRLLARCVEMDRGPWMWQGQDDRGAIGLLVLEGLLTRDVEIEETRSRELLGAGDVIRPWDDDSRDSPVPSRVSWTILEPAVVAVLDRRFGRLAARWPELGLELLQRVLGRSRWLAVLLAIANLRGVEEKVLMLLWHLAGSWGRVTSEGTLVPFALTHEVIADLVGSRRPSVTSALTELQRRGDLERSDEGWLLLGEPPASAG